MSDTETYVCSECEQPAEDPHYSDTRWSSVKEAWVCWGCYETACNYASTLYLIDPDEVTKVTVTDLEVMGEYGEHLDSPVIKRTYTHTSAWRGYYTTTVEGYVEVETGWTTGGWGDPTADRKRTFNDWAKDLVEGDLDCPARVALAFDLTSNVFSTAVTVYVHADDVETFKAWLDDETARQLHDSLT